MFAPTNRTGNEDKLFLNYSSTMYLNKLKDLPLHWKGLKIWIHPFDQLFKPVPNSLWTGPDSSTFALRTSINLLKHYCSLIATKSFFSFSAMQLAFTYTNFFTRSRYILQNNYLMSMAFCGTMEEKSVCNLKYH